MFDMALIHRVNIMLDIHSHQAQTLIGTADLRKKESKTGIINQDLMQTKVSIRNYENPPSQTVPLVTNL